LSLDPEHLAHARRVADAILYEGYLLYPYRWSAQKNQARFQFGVLVPPAYAAVDESERSASQTECLAECPDAADVVVLVRFLQFQRRTVQALSTDGGLHEVAVLSIDDAEYRSWDEAVPREQQVTAGVAELLSQGKNLSFHISGGQSAEDITNASGVRAGRVVRRWGSLDGLIRIQGERVAGPYLALRLRVRVENHTVPDGQTLTRYDALDGSLISAHALIGVRGGTFLSPTDPPEWAAAEVAACVSIGTWPVLAGPGDCRDLILSAPVILYDHPEVAAESAGDLFDATEIDEILTLRTLALTDTEKREARATDPRAAELIDRLDNMPQEMIERLHGAIRYLRSPGTPRASLAGVGAEGERAAVAGVPFAPDVPWWDPGADTSVSPGTDQVIIDGVPVARGSKVIMRPGSRRADAQDLFLAGRIARVEAVMHDVDDEVHIAVSPDDDPAADLQSSHGRFLYFAPDEIEPIAPEHRRAT
jgi:hypothetical protein